MISEPLSVKTLARVFLFKTDGQDATSSREVRPDWVRCSWKIVFYQTFDPKSRAFTQRQNN